MAKKDNTNNLIKSDWVQRFNLVGKAVINDYTYRINAKSEKSDWVYNSLNLQIDCGEKYGKVGCELMGGYGASRDNILYVHGKNDDGRDDFQNQYTIAWEDRFDETILEDLGDLCFLTVGVEKDSKDNTFYNKFLSPYDMIAYLNDNLEDGTVVNVRGQLRYTLYNDQLQCRKEINSIALSKAEPENYHATFTQSMLIDGDSCTRDSIDKDKSVLMIDAYLLEKFREYNGHDLTEDGKIRSGQFVPLRKTFEFPVDLETDQGKANMKKVMTKFFKVKKGTVTQLTMLGEFIESGATVKATVEDLTDDIKELIEMGVYTEEEALATCADNGNRERRMLITKPMIKKVGDDDKKVPVIQKFEERFEEDDLLLDCLIKKEEEDEEVDDVDTSAEVEETADDGDDWLSTL